METVIRSDVRDLAKSIVERGVYKYQSEIVRDAVRGIVNKASKKLDESLSQAVMKMREEAT